MKTREERIVQGHMKKRKTEICCFSKRDMLRIIDKNGQKGTNIGSHAGKCPTARAE